MNSFKKFSEYFGVFSAGVIISASFVIISNDLFYDKYFKINNKVTQCNDLWNELRPREIFGTGAKKTFIKHQIKFDKNDEKITYVDYVERNKNDIEEKIKIENNYEIENDEIFKKSFKNIYDNKN